MFVAGCSGCDEPRPYPTSVSGVRVKWKHLAFDEKHLVSSPLVLVHSYTGRTEIVAETLVRMFGGRLMVYGDHPPKMPDLNALPNGKRLRPMLKKIPESFVFFGFPIWSHGIPQPVVDLIDSMDLKGKKVLFFYTYIHYADPGKIEEVLKKISLKGAEIVVPLEFRLDAHVKRDVIERLVEKAVFARTDLWSYDEHPKVSCAPDKDTRDMTLCQVPKGRAWVHVPERPLEKTVVKRVVVDAFSMNRSEITLRQYRRCVEDGVCSPMRDDTHCKRLLQDDSSLPILGLHIDDAKAFCKWADMRLPTIGEWTRAARGQTLYDYPWGWEFPSDGSRLNRGQPPETGLKYFSLGKPGTISDPFPGLAPVCSFPEGKSVFGLCDMAGNLSEWVTLSPQNPKSYALIGGSWLETDPAAFKFDAAYRMQFGKGFYLSGLRCVKE